MSIFKWRSDAIIALKICNDELKRMHELLYKEDTDFNITTKTEILIRIVKLQDTVNEGTRRLCGLEY